MDLSDNLNVDRAARAQLDVSVLVVAFATAVFALVLATLTCVCCYRRRSGSFNSRSDSRRDTVPLDDLLSKPSLADPESVFSEAGSYDLPRSARAASWMRVSGEGSSIARESVSVSCLSVDDKGQSTFTGAGMLNPTPEVPTKWTVQSHRSSLSGQTDKSHNHGQHQRYSFTSKYPDQSSLTETQTIGETRRHGDDCILDLSRGVKVAGSPKNHTHKDISNRVRVDSAALKIHRDSVTRESMPFLSSARCSFSHEVGHIVHGSKVPRTSLPTTEEQCDDCSKRLSGPSNVGRASVTTKLSLQVHTEQTSLLSKCSSDDNTAGTQTGGPSVLYTEGQPPSPDAHKYSSRAPRSNFSSDISPGSSTGQHNDTSQHGPVPMRRCMSCVHGDGVCDDQLPSPRRKTFSLNLKIDVHFENGRDRNENVSTVVCSPCIDYSTCDKLTSASDKCNARGVSDNCATNLASDKYEKYATNSNSMLQHLTPNSATNTNEASDRVDTDAKERLLQKSFELKSQSMNSQPFVAVHKLRSDPMINVNSALKDCNVRHFSRLSDSCTPAMPLPQVTNSQLVPGQGIFTELGHRSDLREADSRPRGHLSASLGEQMLPSRIASVPAARQQAMAITSHAVTELKTDTDCLNVQAETIDTGDCKSFSRTDRQLPVGESEKTSMTPESVKTSNVVVGVCSDVITEDDEGREDRDDFSQGMPDTNLKDEARLVITREEDRPRQGKHRSAGSNSSGLYDGAVPTADPDTLQNRVCYQPGVVSTYVPKPSGNGDGGITFGSRGITPGTTVRSVVDRAWSRDITPATRPDITPATRLDITPATRLDITPATRPDITPATRPDITPSTRPDITPSTRPDITPATCPDITPATCPDITPATCPDITPATRHDITPATRPDITPAACPDITPATCTDIPQAACTDVNQNSPEASSRLVQPRTDRPVLEAEKGVGPVTRTSEDGKISGVHDCHRRAQTLKKRYGWATAATDESTDSRFMRASSLKVHSSERETQQTSLSPSSGQHRRKVVPLKKDDITSSKSSVDRESMSRLDSKLAKETQDLGIEAHQLSHTKEPDIKEDRNSNFMKQAITVTHESSKVGAEENTHKQNIREFVELNTLSEAKHKMEDMAESQGSRSAKSNKDRTTLSSQEPIRCTSYSAAGQEPIRCTSDSAACLEPLEVSDDSDYDNPWDDLDDAVKRASIRYSRRPSRIAAGDTKTLLLKSAEDLGRLLEEADKRRQLRQARNSYQIASPECVTDSMTIPFTRYSPHRHTVKGIVSQPHLSTSHSSEDILKAHTPTYPKLSLLRQQDETEGSGKGIDARRPMSLVSKVKAKVASPETKKRKK